MKTTTLTKALYSVSFLAIVAYPWLTFTTHSSSNVFKLTNKQLVNLRLTVVVPVIIIWLLGTYGVTRFKSYAASIKNDPDGKGFNMVANGLMILIYGGITSSLFTAIYNRLNPELAAVPTRTIITNYWSILVALSAYTVILRGGVKLVTLVGAMKSFKKTLPWVLAIAAVLGLAFFLIGFKNLPVNNTRPYYLPRNIVALTLMIPYVVSWVLGFAGFAAILTYAAKVKGTLYRRALMWLRAGLGTVITFSISLQFLTVLNFALQKWSLKGILILLYVIIVIYALGYVFIAKGARKLHKIEELSLGSGGE